MKTALFWAIAQRVVVVISYRHFGTSYQYVLQGPRIEDGTDMFSRNVRKELPLLAV